MGLFALVALIVNLIAVLPLLPYRDGDANMRAVWLFSRNDAIGNVAVIIAAGLVALTSTRWPDLIVAFLIAALFLHSAWNILRDARRDLSVVTSARQTRWRVRQTQNDAARSLAGNLYRGSDPDRRPIHKSHYDTLFDRVRRLG